MNIVALTDSLGESAGGLSHATLNLATSVAAFRHEDHLSILCHEDQEEIDRNVVLLDNFKIVKQPCWRNAIYPVSMGLTAQLDALQPDLVHVRGLWRQGSLVARHWKKRYPGRKLIVQSAGMLEPWARKRNSWLKRLYFSYSESRLFDCCDAVHATSAAEAKNLNKLGIPKDKIFIIEEGIFIPSESQLHRLQLSGPRKLLFLSRIHPKKGIELLLEALALLRPTQWICQIVGMGEAAYIAALKARIKVLNLDSVVEFVGPLYGAQKERAFQEASAFILPTYSENFGIAVAEAMSWGLPVITTTETPWSVLENPAMGWCVKPELNPISYALYQLFAKSPQELVVMGQVCREYVSHRFSWESIGMKMSEQYDQVLASDCIHS